MPASADFRLSITRALADQLAAALWDLEPEPLTLKNLNELPRRAGIYQLYLGEKMVYVGKADPSLPNRLAKHFYKISGRKNIDIAMVRYACLFVDEDMPAVAPERLLIAKYKQAGEAPWNFNGFGSNDPGRERDTTTFEKGHFDVAYPADLNWECQEITAGQYRASDLLAKTKKALPYVFRYQGAEFHNHVTVTVPQDKPTAHELFTLLGKAIAAQDPQWRITALPGYVIMYPKDGPFPSARKTYR